MEWYRTLITNAREPVLVSCCQGKISSTFFLPFREVYQFAYLWGHFERKKKGSLSVIRLSMIYKYLNLDFVVLCAIPCMEICIKLLGNFVQPRAWVHLLNCNPSKLTCALPTLLYRKLNRHVPLQYVLSLFVYRLALHQITFPRCINSIMSKRKMDSLSSGVLFLVQDPDTRAISKETKSRYPANLQRKYRWSGQLYRLYQQDALWL